MGKLNALHKKLLLVLAGYMIANIAIGQTLVNGLQQQFTFYQINNYNEKVFVHTDKTFYLAGESIWFKLYCVDENFHKPSDISRVAYVEIISAEKKAVLQAKISLNEGSGNGSLIIPSYVVSGNYVLRAYTKWMENFDADYFFQTPITIVNTLKPGVVKTETQTRSYQVSFFPEGGNLVEGIQSKIAFKVVDEHGEPVDCSGAVTNSNNNTIATFQSLKFGMGSFNFTPKSNENYKAIIKLEDTTITQQLPASYKKGYVMHTENTDDDHIKVSVSTNTNNAIAYLLVHSQNVLKDFQQANISNGESNFIIDKNKLADGISVITIFNSAKQPVCERLYFKKPASRLNIQLQADNNHYSIRKPVNVSINTSQHFNKPAMANMSVAIFMIDSLQTSNYNDIFSYLLLSSELKGKITSPEYYFQLNDKEADEAADNLMLTQGWRRFKWENLLQDKKPYFEFLPEHEGLVIDGTISNTSNAPAQNIDATLTVPGEDFQLADAKSNANGKLLFNVKRFYGTDNIIVKTDSNYRITITSAFSDKFSQYASTAFTIPAQSKNDLLFRSINVQADNAYLINEKQHAYSYDAEDTSLFYGMPDKRYYLDNYTRFTSMEEVMREYVTEVHVRKESDQFRFRVSDFSTKTFFDTDPLILFDGMPVTNATRIILFDPLKIKRLDVVARKYYYGNIITDGIVSFTTYRGDLADIPLTAGEIVVKFDGLQHEREFYSPVYSTDEQIKNRLPDLRNVLYWSPKIETGADGKAGFNFYTSDITGKFACIVQGITADGFAGSNMITFDVTK
ncbi:MAG: hypothetical protein JO072_16820 [Parafilimonas sp.]|nr:hypothetical protein [Parafilimonas sp.]